MGISTFPNVASPIKSIQRGAAATSADITISAVNVNKTQVSSFPTSSGGQVIASANIPAMTGAIAATTTYLSGFTATFGFTGGNYTSQIQNYNASNANYTPGNFISTNARYGITNYNAPTVAGFNTATPNYANVAASGVNAITNIAATNLNFNTQALGAGSTALWSAAYGVFLVNSTTLTATGACRYEVVEHY